MTSSDLITLRKVLALERQKGCRDTAVVGGLDGFLARWLDRLPDQPPVRLPRPGYASMSADQRSRWLNDTLTLLDGDGASTPPAAQRRADTPKRTTRAVRPRPQRAEQERSLASPVEALPRVSSTIAGRLKRLGVTTVRDLLYPVPAPPQRLRQPLPHRRPDYRGRPDGGRERMGGPRDHARRADAVYRGRRRRRNRQPARRVVQPAAPRQSASGRARDWRSAVG